MDALPPTSRTRLRRLPDRGSFDLGKIYAILDEALFCHVGFVDGEGPVVIPTVHARRHDTLYIHGSAASRMLRSVKTGIDVCVTVTLLDGLVLARAAFHNSVNYRSVMIFGRAAEVTDAAEKAVALEAITDHVAPGQWAEIRPVSPEEIAQTIVLSLPIEEASAKVRSGPPIDDEEDYSLPIWAGVIPVALTFGAPTPDPRLSPGLEPPGYARRSE